MVIETINGQAVDKSHLYFIQSGSGPILIGLSMLPDKTALSMQSNHYETLSVLASRVGSIPDLNAARAFLARHCIRGNWFAPSPEVLDYARGMVPDGEPPRRGGRRLTQAQVVEVFTLAHGSSQAYAIVGEKYGISGLAVGKIARGQVYPALFRRDDVTEDEPMVDGVYLQNQRRARKGDYYISLRVPDSAPRYRLTPGKRGVK